MIEIIVPSPGESITQVQIARWLVDNGQEVEKDQEIVEIDSDKATFPVAAPEHGILTITIPQGEMINVGSVIATLEPTLSHFTSAHKTPTTSPKTNVLASSPPADLFPASVTPLAKKMIAEQRIDSREVASAFPGRRITKKDITSFVKEYAQQKGRFSFSGERAEEREKLSMLRLKLAERLVAVKNNTAMLTTFNEVNLRVILDIKSTYTDAFMKKYGVGIGLTSFFAKAVTLALADFPQINARIEEEELVFPRYVDLGIAVSAPKGLVVPVIRNAESLSLAEIEIRVKELAAKARNNRITIDDMTGGTFTITNGGVFGSLMSTPILNPPQSGILGMHKIMDRPVAVDGRVEIHPMMYIALSYDHRVIDGRESVGFLVKIKEILEDPTRMLTSGEDPFNLLLNI